MAGGCSHRVRDCSCRVWGCSLGLESSLVPGHGRMVLDHSHTAVVRCRTRARQCQAKGCDRTWEGWRQLVAKRCLSGRSSNLRQRLYCPSGTSCRQLVLLTGKSTLTSTSAWPLLARHRLASLTAAHPFLAWTCRPEALQTRERERVAKVQNQQALQQDLSSAQHAHPVLTAHKSTAFTRCR